jgi:hypothetical protein
LNHSIDPVFAMLSPGAFRENHGGSVFNRNSLHPAKDVERPLAAHALDDKFDERARDVITIAPSVAKLLEAQFDARPKCGGHSGAAI